MSSLTLTSWTPNDTRHPSLDDVILRPIFGASWRVMDDRYDDGDARGLLGFVEAVDSRYEVTTMATPAHRQSCESLESARRLVVEDGAIPRPSGARGDGHWSRVARTNHSGV